MYYTAVYGYKIEPLNHTLGVGIPIPVWFYNPCSTTVARRSRLCRRFHEDDLLRTSAQRAVQRAAPQNQATACTHPICLRLRHHAPREHEEARGAHALRDRLTFTRPVAPPQRASETYNTRPCGAHEPPAVAHTLAGPESYQHIHVQPRAIMRSRSSRLPSRRPHRPHRRVPKAIRLAPSAQLGPPRSCSCSPFPPRPCRCRPRPARCPACASGGGSAVARVESRCLLRVATRGASVQSEMPGHAAVGEAGR